MNESALPAKSESENAGRGGDAGTRSTAGALLDWTPRDRGLVDRPMICPHLEVRAIGDDTVFLVSETANYALYGRVYRHLATAIDGQRSRHDLVVALADIATPLQVNTAIARMAAKGYIVSAETRLPAGQAAFWSSIGISPLAAEQRLYACPVAVTGADTAGRDQLVTALAEIGIAAAPSRDGDAPGLRLTLVGDYLDPVLAEVNAAQLANGAAWALCRIDGLQPMAGPVFRPRDGACWDCLAHRMRGNREVANFLGHFRAGQEALAPRVKLPVGRQAAIAMVAMEVAKWIVLGARGPIHDRILSLNLASGISEHHVVVRRPQCRSCGDAALNRPDREPQPIRLVSRTKTLFTSGGRRSVPPAETVNRYRHQVSPISGVVTQLMRTSAAGDPWLHVFWAGSNLALRNNSLRLLRTSLRTKSSGKGSEPDQAEASALCEAIERYSGVFHGDEIRRRARFLDFAPGEAMDPNTVMGYSQRQYAMRDDINAQQGRFNYVPDPFDPAAERDWTPIWSLTHDRWRWLPTTFLYFAYHGDGQPNDCGPDSNGAAAGNTLEEAILQGFFELVERDAFAIWWYNRLSRPRVDLASFGDPYLAAAEAYYRSRRRDLWVLDVTSDLGIPVFVAVSRRTDKPAEDIIFSAGAHLDPRIAMLRAVCELNQYMSAFADVPGDDGLYLYDDPESLHWWKTVRLADVPFLSPDRNVPVRRLSDWTPTETNDLLDDITYCRSLVEARGMEMLVLDQTRPDIGMPVAKVVVPGMRHFWSRLGAGRLYDVPVAQGWLARPTPESELNPHAVFI